MVCSIVMFMWSFGALTNLIKCFRTKDQNSKSCKKSQDAALASTQRLEQLTMAAAKPGDVKIVPFMMEHNTPKNEALR